MQALIPDARAPGAGQKTIVERLLSIIGEDSLKIDRKNKDPVTLTLRSRILLLSNEELQGPSHSTTESSRDDLGGEAKKWAHLKHLTFSKVLGDAKTRKAGLNA